MTTPAKGRADYYAEGDWNARCSMCGFKRKASQLVKNWQGMWRCREHDEPRDPQDFVRAVQDVQTPAWVQNTTDQYIGVSEALAIELYEPFSDEVYLTTETGEIYFTEV